MGLPLSGINSESMLHGRLREATSKLHRTAEARLDILRSDLSLSRYRRILETFYGFYLPLEEQLAHADLGFELRHRSPLLSRDLIALGRTPRELEEVPRCPDVPRVHTVADAAGCLYVVEGAALGGQVIAKAIERHLGIGAGAGASFFFGDGPDTAARWMKVLAWLEALAPRAGCDPIVAAACETFESFTRWMEQA